MLAAVRRSLQLRPVPPLTLVAPKRAAVAILLRRRPPVTAAAAAAQQQQQQQQQPELDCFFILRAARAGSRWGGQVGFPGGRQEEGESDRETVCREVAEEVGWDLEGWELIGQLDDISAQGGPAQHRANHVDPPVVQLAVSCFVYLAKEGQDGLPPVRLQPTEIAACGWAPIGAMLAPSAVRALEWKPGQTLRMLSPGVDAAAGLALYPAVQLPVEDLQLSVGDTAIKARIEEGDRRDAASRFVLWGLSLRMLSQMLLGAQLAKPGWLELPLAARL